MVICGDGDHGDASSWSMVIPCFLKMAIQIMLQMGLPAMVNDGAYCLMLMVINYGFDGKSWRFNISNFHLPGMMREPRDEHIVGDF